MLRKTNRTRPLSPGCDFCAQASFIEAYACYSFVYLKGEAVEYHSRQEWAACANCASLIDAGEWHSLTERALTALVKRYRLSRSEIPFFRQRVEGLYNTFRRHIIAES